MNNDDRRARPTIRFDRMAPVLSGLAGRTIDRIFLAEYSGTRFRVIFAFTDGTSYEFYGYGDIRGAGQVEPASADAVRSRFATDSALQLHEVGAPAPLPEGILRPEAGGTIHLPNILSQPGVAPGSFGDSARVSALIAPLDGQGRRWLVRDHHGIECIIELREHDQWWWREDRSLPPGMRERPRDYRYD